jgi:methionyl-tRNA formyltransferase
VRVVFAGTPEPALLALEAIVASRHELVGVVTRPDAPSGRGRRMTPSPVAERAAAHGVPVLKPHHPREPEFQDALRDLTPDCCPVVAYGALLPQSALDIPPHGWVNLHFSCLPAWRGAAPVQHALWAGDEVTGATTFRIVKELDAGPTYGVMTERIRPTDTAGDLLARLAEGGAGLLVTTLDGIEDGSLEARAQPEDGVSLAPKISVEDAHLDWGEPAVAVDRRIRACTPAPGAWTSYDGLRVKLGAVTVLHEVLEEVLAPGELRVGKTEVLVGTATTAVRLGEVKAFGSRQMAAADWARGLRLPAGARFDSGQPGPAVE